MVVYVRVIECRAGRGEGIAVIYTEDTPGREFVDQAHAAIPADAVARLTEAGSKLTIQEALDLARAPQTAAA